MSKLNKEINKLVGEESQRQSSSRTRDTFLVSDSEGRFIDREITPQNYGELKIISKSGATVDNTSFHRQFLPNIKIAINPIALIWLGTYELTTNSGKLIELRADTYEKNDRIIVKYRYLKSDIQRCNRHAEIICLTCPYYYVLEWNRKKGCSDLSV